MLKKNKNIIYFIIVIILLFFVIRLNNLKNYHSNWADDGGGRVIYAEKVINEYRLPYLDEIYLAWHEPFYYVALAVWVKVGKVFGLGGLNFWESFNIFISLIFLILVWLFSFYYSKKNKWLALLNTFIFSIIFVGVKLSAYVNNELLLHTFILLLIVLFLKFKLNQDNQYKKVVYWSLILAITALTKITALIILIAVLLFWFIKFISTRYKYFLKYIFITLFVVFSINIPWVIYKEQNFDSYFSINIYDTKPRQNIITSDGWSYIFKINNRIFIDSPYWFSKPDSYFSILLSDTFGDYYNLFNNNLIIGELPNGEKIRTGNGRYTTLQLWNTMLNINRLSLLIVAIWFIGFGLWIIDTLKKRKIKDKDLFLLLIMLGGWAASLFHNLRIPYLEVGILKAHFIYFTYPILSFFAYRQWWRIIKQKVWWFLLAFLPWLLYLIIGWNILLISFDYV